MIGKIFEYRIIKKIVNIPFLWNTWQSLLGANDFKLELYPSVFKNKGTILDFGCSIGNTTKAFLDFEYYGIDIDPNTIKAAQKTFASYPNINFICLDILSRGFKPGFFDNVLCATVGHHLFDDQLVRVIAALFEEIKPGGELHFFDIIRQPGKDKLSTRLIINMDQGKYVRTAEEYKRLFKDHGYYFIENKMFPTPNRFVTLPSIMYMKLLKPMV